MTNDVRRVQITPIHSDEVEKRLMEAADAIRRNSERGRTIQIRRAVIKYNQNKRSIVEDNNEETGEDEDLE